MKKFLLVLMIFQCFLLLAEQVEVTVAPNNLIFNYFYPSYIDPKNPEDQPLLFTITAMNHTNQDISDYEVHLSFAWRGDILVDGVVVTPKESGSFYTIPAGGAISISSKDIIISDDTNGFNSESGFDFDDLMDSSPDFKDLLLELGYFPDGEYAMNILLYKNGEAISDNETFSFTVVSPTPITLISPGSPYGLGDSTISNLNPYFVWFSNLQYFTFRLYKIEDEFENVEDIELMSDPICEIEDLNSTILAYPATAEPLEYGSLYAWQVQADLITPLSAFAKKTSSSFYFFKVDDTPTGNSNDLMINLFMQLDNDDIKELVNLLKSGYEIGNMKFGSEILTVDQLNKLIMQLIDGTYTIKNVDIN